jgi:excisionase family DNA binding protein
MPADPHKGLDPEGARCAGTTLREALEEYLKVKDLSAKSVRDYRHRIETYLSAWLDYPLQEITREMVEMRHRDIAAEIEKRHRAAVKKTAERYSAWAQQAEARGWLEATARHRAAAAAAAVGKPPSGQPTADRTIWVLRALLNFPAERVPDLPLNPVMKRIPTHRTPVASKSTIGETATRTAKNYERGNRRPKGFPPEAGVAGRKTGLARANARALALSPIIAEIRAHGVTRPHAIAAALTDRSVPTARGCRFWTSDQVRHVLDRLDRLGHLNSANAQSSTSPRPERAVESLDSSGTMSSNTSGEIIPLLQARRRGRPTVREIVALILTQMRAEGAPLREPYRLLAKMVAARNNCALGDRNWHEATIREHVSKWLSENPDDANDYRVALTLKEAARKTGVKRAMLDVAIDRGTLRAHKCGARTLILQSDLQRFAVQVPGLPRGRRPGP